MYRDTKVSRQHRRLKEMARLPDPTTNPKGPGFTQASLTPNYPGMHQTLNSASVVSVQVGGTYWEISVTYPDMTPEEIKPLHLFLLGLQGAFTPFEIQLPQHANPASGALTAPQQGVVQAASGDTLVIHNWDNVGGNVTAGDMIKLSNGNKIYTVISDSYTAGGVKSGIKTLKLNFPLAQAVTSVDKIEPNNILFRVKIKGESPTITLGTNGLYRGFSLAVRESLL